LSNQIPLVDLHAQYAQIRDEIHAAIDRVLERQSFVLGPETSAFEAEFAAFSGAREAVALSNGTTALELALWSLGVGPGDEVITVSWTFWATVEAVLRAGATPVFVDVRPDDWTMDPERVAPAVTPRTKVVLPVHIYGHPADVPAIAAAAPNAIVLEDAAQAHGASYYGRPVGSGAAAATFSFFPGKNLGAYGDAGAIVTDDLALASHLRALRDHGRSSKYEHPFPGTNARCSEIQCAVLRTKLRHLREWTEERRRVSSLYEEHVGLPFQATQDWAEHARHLFVVRHADRDRLQQLLAEQGVASGVHYPIPAHRQPGLHGVEWRAVGDMSITDELAATVLSLPLYPELGEEGAQRVCAAIHRAATVAA
jgi:dTDP-4-amino-4,6-dideoxygalactose transaminase